MLGLATSTVLASSPGVCDLEGAACLGKARVSGREGEVCGPILRGFLMVLDDARRN